MAINAYTGLMGSGKSFEVVSSVIVPAIKAGRNVVTNIDGINELNIHNYLLALDSKLHLDDFGHVIHVNNERVTQKDFFPSDDSDLNSIVKFGDIVCIDEAWRFWSSKEKISLEHMNFFRMHRHFVNPKTNVSCDLCLMIQSIADLHRSLKAVVEMTALTKKHKSLGFDNRYRVDLFEGSKTTKLTRFDSYQKKYDKKIFPLYSSYNGGTDGKEKAIDSRQNIFKNKRLWFMLAIGLFFSIISFKLVWGFFHREELKTNTSKNVEQGSSVSSPVVASSASNYRIAGTVGFNGQKYTVIQDPNSRLRLENPAIFVGDGIFAIGNYEGEKVSTYTGIFHKNTNQKSLDPTTPTK